MEAVYDYTVASLNRAVPVVIAVYRYLHVFSGNQFMDKHHKKKVQMYLLAYALGKITMNQWLRVFRYIFSGSSLFNGILVVLFPGNNRRYMFCTGSQESFLFNSSNFYQTTSGSGPLTSLPNSNPFK